MSLDTLQKLSSGRFDGTITAFPDDNSDIPMPLGAPKYRRKVWAVSWNALNVSKSDVHSVAGLLH